MDEVSEPSCLLQVGLTYNLKKANKTNEIEPKAIDDEAEYDEITTVLAIKEALENERCQVTLLEADQDLPVKLSQKKYDIIFNIAEGIYGRGREAQVPALLNFYKIPFTGSDETTLCIALDKALTKRLLSTYRIKTPKYQIVEKNQPQIDVKVHFPAIVKPNAEGSSKGISDVAIVTNKEELLDLVKKNISLYKEDMLVEEYIDGREFTVGVLGNDSDVRVFPPMEIVYLNQENDFKIYSYNVKLNYKKLIRYECPANIPQDIEAKMMNIAKKIFEVLSCKDFARIDFRLSQEGEIYFIEINPLPGLAPGYSDFPMIAEFNGMDYNTLVRNVLKSALKRYGMSSYME